mmetsp:Transcript_28333/g.52864  ORF Transcript_28333/g.52864 Transcript_28333/m.52864 type:complete len:276 (+) Transcript_28333:1285-2112(+)
MRPRDIKRFGGGGHHDQPVFDSVDMGHGNVGVAGHHQIVVNLVRDHDQVVAFGKGGNGSQFAPAPDTAARIVWRTQDQHPLGPVHLGIIGVKIQLIAAVRQGHLAFHHAPPIGFDDLGKGMVAGREQNDAIAGLGKGVDAHRSAVDQAMGGKDRVGIHAPAVTLGHPPLDRRRVCAVIAEIANDAVIRLALHRVQHPLRRAEIHIGDPHGQPAIPRHTVDLFHPIPFHAMAAPALDHLVKAHATLLTGVAGQATRVRPKCKGTLQRAPPSLKWTP